MWLYVGMGGDDGMHEDVGGRHGEEHIQLIRVARWRTYSRRHGALHSLDEFRLFLSKEMLEWGVGGGLKWEARRVFWLATQKKACRLSDIHVLHGD